MFITFEGPEGSGKTTHARLLYEYLREEEYPVVLTREPGGTRISDKVRGILLDPNSVEMLPRTEVLLFSSARAQLCDELIRPELKQGKTVICDRYSDSTIAYQGYAEGLDPDTLRVITEFATGGLRPDLTIYLDLPVEIGFNRLLGPVKHEDLLEYEGQLPLFIKWDRFGIKGVEFHRRVQEGYEQLIKAEPERWHRVDANRPLEQVQDDVRRKVLSVLEDRS